MSRRARSRFAIAIIGSAAALSCASTSSLLSQRFAREHSCQKDKVLVRQSGANRYLAEGCGQRAEYVCGSFIGSPGSEHNCSKSGANPRATTELPARTTHGLQDPPK